ncbi:helix-turn-helix domain-containing protein [Paenibacillus sp. Leaf72]|uniref:helix-turn-helix domain-containing protein n=1 Tax=Paenibacillus sp. Leaf72 TaxID=1736234 RepID=UPI0007014CE0|nr:AraC family transcriptional regulator [Paenibacillus sp. Leaf72]KQO17969.1 AraC family transcriptional regulator [Paenibacillus sp. Leaf72]
MEAFNEQVPYENPLLSIRIFRTQRSTSELIKWHYHKQLELIYIINGSLKIDIEDDSFDLESGDIVVLGSSQLHRDRNVGKLDYIVLQFNLEDFFDNSTIPYIRYFSETENPLSRANYIFRENKAIRQQASEAITKLLHEATHKETGYEIAVSIQIKQLLLLMLRGDSQRILARQDDFDHIRLKPVLDYVENNLGERIQVEDMCRIVNMSYYYFVKFFKKTIGLSFTEYVNYRKIKWAERILLTKDLSIADVGERIGMPNMAHFYKTFKKYNDCSPKQFQRKMLEWDRS